MTFQWLQQFPTIFFDFDGLLVDTEPLHYQAYQAMLQGRGLELTWDFAHYVSIAHFSSGGLEQEIYKDFPQLKQEEPDWAVLYREKKAKLEELFHKVSFSFMPGIEEMLQELPAYDLKTCVVTNSTKKQTEIIKKKLPLLQNIPNWVTREDYSRPKPSPDSYLAALEKMGVSADEVIGFEDTIRGLRALKAAGIKGVLLSAPHHPQMKDPLAKGSLWFPSMKEINISLR